MNEKHINPALAVGTNDILVRTNEKAKNLPRKSYYIANADYYNVFIRDGKIIGMPQPCGGPIFPHSQNCIKPPSLFEPRYSSFSLMVIPKDFMLKFEWDVMLTIPSPVSGKDFDMPTRLTLYPLVDDLHIPENMERFMNAYNILRVNGADVDWECYTVDDWKTLIGNDITEIFKSRLAEYFKNNKNHLRDAAYPEDVDTSVLLYSLYHPFNHIFKKYGLTLIEDDFFEFFSRYVKFLFDIIFKTFKTEI